MSTDSRRPQQSALWLGVAFGSFSTVVAAGVAGLLARDASLHFDLSLGVAAGVVCGCFYGVAMRLLSRLVSKHLSVRANHTVYMRRLAICLRCCGYRSARAVGGAFVFEPRWNAGIPVTVSFVDGAAIRGPLLYALVGIGLASLPGRSALAD